MERCIYNGRMDGIGKDSVTTTYRMAMLCSEASRALAFGAWGLGFRSSGVMVAWTGLHINHHTHGLAFPDARG